MCPSSIRTVCIPAFSSDFAMPRSAVTAVLSLIFKTVQAGYPCLTFTVLYPKDSKWLSTPRHTDASLANTCLPITRTLIFASSGYSGFTSSARKRKDAPLFDKSSYSVSNTCGFSSQKSAYVKNVLSALRISISVWDATLSPSLEKGGSVTVKNPRDESLERAALGMRSSVIAILIFILS